MSVCVVTVTAFPSLSTTKRDAQAQIKREYRKISLHQKGCDNVRVQKKDLWVHVLFITCMLDCTQAKNCIKRTALIYQANYIDLNWSWLFLQWTGVPSSKLYALPPYSHHSLDRLLINYNSNQVKEKQEQINHLNQCWAFFYLWFSYGARAVCNAFLLPEIWFRSCQEDTLWASIQNMCLSLWQY